MNDEKVDVKRKIYRSFFRAINTNSKKKLIFISLNTFVFDF